MDNKAVDRKNLVLFPLGTFGRDMIYALVTNFLLSFIMFTQNLNARQLAAITFIMIGARVFDALNDPVMGNIIERTRTKWGKFKPWLLSGILFTFFVVYSMFNNPFEGWAFVITFAILYFMYSIAYTMHDISYWGMIPALSRNAEMRNKFTSRTTLIAGIGGTLANILIPMFTTGAFAIGGSAKIAYGRIALIVCLIAPVFLLFTIAGVREDRHYMPAASADWKWSCTLWNRSNIHLFRIRIQRRALLDLYDTWNASYGFPHDILSRPEQEMGKAQPCKGIERHSLVRLCSFPACRTCLAIGKC